VDITGYSGKIGQFIKIKVSDDFEVKMVKLTIYKQDGSLQEGAMQRQTMTKS
jgi:hypothetical protein